MGRDERADGNGHRRRRRTRDEGSNGFVANERRPYRLTRQKRPENPKDDAVIMLIKSRRFIKTVDVNHEIHGSARDFRVILSRREIESPIICSIVAPPSSRLYRFFLLPYLPPAILDSTGRSARISEQSRERFYYSRKFHLCFEPADIESSFAHVSATGTRRSSFQKYSQIRTHVSVSLFIASK